RTAGPRRSADSIGGPGRAKSAIGGATLFRGLDQRPGRRRAGDFTHDRGSRLGLYPRLAARRSARFLMPIPFLVVLFHPISRYSGKSPTETRHDRRRAFSPCPGKADASRATGVFGGGLCGPARTPPTGRALAAFASPRR